jgi:hypothetical protein
MKTLLALVAGLSMAAASAQAQVQPMRSTGFGQPYHAPAQPKPPSMPDATSGGGAFKPFHGMHTTSNRGGVDPYPKAPKPKGGFSTYGH